MEFQLRDALIEMQKFGDEWARFASSDAPEELRAHFLKLFSWKIAFFTIQSKVKTIERVKPKEEEIFKMLNEIIQLVQISPKLAILFELYRMPEEDQAKLTRTYEQTLQTFKRTVEGPFPAPLKCASEFFDCSEHEQCKILGINN
ncbi:hypothetical protein DL93DRAFT_2170983 [Clavulina sp. PMI_390]|nr:hypothetical protein DL93DRAFT_2170983 [Clavulina sp. PMI_390]